MSGHLWVDYLKFVNGHTLSFEPNSIVVFVGPNNSGKSKLLQEILQSSKGYNQNPLIVEDVKYRTEGTADDFLNKIQHRLKGTTYMYHTGENSPTGIDGSYLRINWENLSNGSNTRPQGIGNFLIQMLNTSQRLNLINPPKNIDSFTELESHPIHILKKDESKELLFSEYFKLAFGEDVIINHGAGLIVPLHVGRRPERNAENDRVSTSYQKTLRKLPVLHEQGDGMKSFAGVFLSLFAQDFSVNIIDEPEAFLHPPQAFLLGKLIAEKLDQNKQLLIATHSEHLLKGLLESATNRLIVVRLQRDDNVTRVNVLENKLIKDIWKDSLLHHSNILDGLFHKKVVLVESDSDSRFYSAITSAVVEKENVVASDILFIYSSGKHRFPTVIKALKDLNVPLTIVGDFDFYHDENPVRYIFELLGGSWAMVKSDFEKVKKSIDEKRPELEVDALKKEIESTFTSFNDTIIPDAKIKEIQTALKKSSPWKQAKASGRAYLPAGEAIQAFQRFQTELKKKNIYILDIGEIEAFDKSIGGHGPKWVNQVLEKDLINDPELESARNFVKDAILKI